MPIVLNRGGQYRMLWAQCTPGLACSVAITPLYRLIGICLSISNNDKSLFSVMIGETA